MTAGESETGKMREVGWGVMVEVGSAGVVEEGGPREGIGHEVVRKGLLLRIKEGWGIVAGSAAVRGFGLELLLGLVGEVRSGRRGEGGGGSDDGGGGGGGLSL